VIGLELHAQLRTRTKQFCRCEVRFTNAPEEANKFVCPICLGHPGVLPVLNRASVELSLRLASVAGSSISRRNIFARKNYFYPDLPKGFQISQYEVPLAEGGFLPYFFTSEPGGEAEVREARFVRMHLEEDTGKNYHLPDGTSIVDFNRCGVPLLEIVTQPDFHSADEAVAYLEEMRLTMIYLGVSDANMELGQMRCEPNVSVRPVGANELRPKTEIKNLNSFATLRKAVHYEIKRQIAVWESGGEVLPQTMRWDDAATGFDGRRGAAVAMRTKETADDYRYFDEPDLPPLVITDEMIERASGFADKTAFNVRARLIEKDGLSEYDAKNIATIPDNLRWYDALLPEIGDAKLTANWILGEISRWRAERGDKFLAEFKTAAQVILALKERRITNPQAKEIFGKVAVTGENPEQLITELANASDAATSDLDAILEEVIKENPAPAADYKKGKKAAVMALVGQVMKKTRGAANAQEAKKLLEEMLDE